MGAEYLFLPLNSLAVTKFFYMHWVNGEKELFAILRPFCNTLRQSSQDMQQVSFTKKSQIPCNVHSTDYSEKSVGKIKGFSKNWVILRTTSIFWWICLLTRKYVRKMLRWTECWVKPPENTVDVRNKRQWITDHSTAILQVQEKRQLLTVFGGQQS